MRTLLLALAIWLVLGTGSALMAATLISDPNPGAEYYRITGASFITATIPAQTDGSIRVDVSAAVVGTTTIGVRACKSDVWNGEVCSVSVPFDLVRPAPSSAPLPTKGLKLAP
jgi:hypothetical protein